MGRFYGIILYCGNLNQAVVLLCTAEPVREVLRCPANGQEGYVPRQVLEGALTSL